MLVDNVRLSDKAFQLFQRVLLIDCVLKINKIFMYLSCGSCAFLASFWWF